MNKIKLLLIVVFAGSFTFSSCKKESGCTDKNANNFDVDAETNSGCVYRYASSIEVSGVSSTNPNGESWDIDGSYPDLKVNFGKSSNSGYDFTTDTQVDTLAASLTPNSNIQFTNQEWKYELVDDDLLSASEIIASGTFNPVTQGGSKVITITNGTITVKFNFTLN